ncbi:uncharacterized protein K02A2.6-like isoform X1 [Sycon ciliatum]|uniref:uncharacterized protein K02A2.6-like isoform X1 n=1 Tax=Sycon ciliatum TaxID=27933 RepID=UPI0031F5F280
MSKDSIDQFLISGHASEVQQRWKKWRRAFQYFIEAKDITDPDRQRSMLLHKAGLQIQEIFEDLEDPVAQADRPGDDNAFKQAVRMLDEHFAYTVNPTFERHVFRQMSPNVGENATQFCTRLRTQAKLCAFAADDEHIRDQMIATCIDVDLQRSLLSKSNLTLQVLLEKFRVRESSGIQVRSMATAASSVSASPSSVDAVRSTTSSTRSPCTRCNRVGHASSADDCPARRRRCNTCSKVGHYAVCCRSQGGTSSSNASRSSHAQPRDAGTHHVSLPDQCDEALSSDFMIANIGSQHSHTGKFRVDVHVNGKPLNMELDTGAQLSIIPEALWKQLWGDVKLNATKTALCTFSGAPLTVVGEACVDVQYQSQHVQEKILVVKEGTTPLFGRNWLSNIRLDWHTICSVSSAPRTSDSESVLDEFPSVFEGGLGKIHDSEAVIHIASGAIPKCYSARPLPYAMKPQVDVELDRLIKEGVLVPVESSEWASPIVVVKKADGSIRLCADFKVTINQHIESNIHPIPNPSDLLSSIAGASVFSKVDLSQAYTQLPLSEDSQKLCVIATHRGLFAFTRLPFGVSSAPSIWQKTIEQILAGIDGVIVYFDDILITGTNQAEHDTRLRQVLDRFEKAGLQLKKAKCELNQESVKYLGFIVSSKGLHADPSKVSAIAKAPQPTNSSELHSFLGLVNFYGRFIPNASQLLYPLNRLLQKGTEWNWTPECQHAFIQCKEILASSNVLAHYDPKKPLILECDASPTGIGACLLQPDKLSVLQEQQLTDYIKSVNVDPCHDLPLSATDVSKATSADPTLRKVMHHITHGWPSSVPDSLSSYYRIRDQLSVEQGCITWGLRVVIPLVFRSSLLHELHVDHLGVSRMKAVARSFFWWPHLDQDIVELAANCRLCQQQARAPTKAPIHHWVYPNRPFERVHLDFAEYKVLQRTCRPSKTLRQLCELFCQVTASGSRMFAMTNGHQRLLQPDWDH